MLAKINKIYVQFNFRKILSYQTYNNLLNKLQNL